MEKDKTGNRGPVLSFVTQLFHKVRNEDALKSLEPNTAIKIEELMEKHIISDDESMDRSIRELTMALKPVPIEPDLALILRASIRPFITITLTVVFIAFLFMWIFGENEVVANLKEMLPVFLGIYGSVVGFWFGEHNAQRSQDKAGRD